MYRYSNSIIYKLSCKNLDISGTYIGSTINYNNRISAHRTVCGNPNSKNYNLKLYQHIREHGGFNNFKFDIIEKVKLENKQDLLKLERKYIESENYSLNIVIPTRSIKEYYLDNIDKRKNYYNDNKLYFQEKQKNYRIKNKEILNKKKSQKIECDICNCLIRRDNISTHKKSLKCVNIKNNFI